MHANSGTNLQVGVNDLDYSARLVDAQMFDLFSSGDIVYNDGQEDITDAALGWGKFSRGLAMVELLGPKDSDESLIIKTKTTKAGWRYDPRVITLKTNTAGSLHNKNFARADIGDAVLKFFDANLGELTQGGQESNQDYQIRLDADCTRTVMDYQPAYDIDVRGGELILGGAPAQPTYGYLVMAPDIAAQYGGSISFVTGGYPIHLMDSFAVKAFEGVTTKTILHDPVYNSNKIRLIIDHAAGADISIGVKYDEYKE